MQRNDDQPEIPSRLLDRPAASSSRRPYRAPRIEALGDVRDVTLGATPGFGDSTPPNTQPG